MTATESSSVPAERQVPASRTLRYLDGQALHALADVIDAAAAPWAREWLGRPVSVRCRNAEDCRSDLPVALNWSGLTSPLPTQTGVAIAAADGTAADWIGRIVCGPEPRRLGSIGITGRVCEAAAEDLRARLARLLGVQGPLHEPNDTANSAEAAVAPSTSRWSGAVVAHLKLDAGDGEMLWLHLAREMVERLQPPRQHQRRAAGRQALTPVVKALARDRIGLQISLEAVDISVSELLNMRAGDVLLTSHALTEPLRVHPRVESTDPKAPSVCQAHLGQQAGRLAVRLLGPAMPVAANPRQGT
jgi:Type III flagellar switch regulator (C-ring) FliN C-term